jgi:molybdate transport system substrate-binding protein
MFPTPKLRASPAALARPLALLLLTAACASASAADLVVSAAASLSNAFKDVAQSYEARYPGTKVALNFAASGVLLQQMDKGAPVDVFASADQETMDAAQAKGLVAAADRVDFVRNSLVVVVPSDSALKPATLAELNQASVHRIAIGNPDSVPAGRYARLALEGARLWPELQPRLIQAQSVRQALDYVARAEVDAGFVYGTDAAQFKDKVKVAFTVPLEKSITYPVASTRSSANGAEARRFVGYLRSEPAQAILAKYGFLKP